MSLIKYILSIIFLVTVFVTRVTYAQYYPQAEQIEVDSSNFTGNFNATITDVQKALDKVDTLSTGGSPLWGAITGTLANQLDLKSALDGKQATGSYLTANQNITLSGDASGSGSTAITVTVADDSHSHTSSTLPLNSNSAAGIVSSGAGQNAKVWKTDASGVPAWRDDALGESGTGITSLNGLNATSQSFSTTNSTLLGISSETSTHTFTPQSDLSKYSWTGVTTDNLTQGSTNKYANTTKEDNGQTAYGWGDHSVAGYLTAEVDGSITNEIQDISLTNDTLSLSGDASTVDLSVYYNSLDDLKSSVSNDFHNLGGTDANTVYTGDTEAVVTGTVLSIGSAITRDTEWDTLAELETIYSANLLVETEIDASSELAALMDDETGTGSLVFNTNATIILPDANGASPTTNGQIKYDRTAKNIQVGDGSSFTTYYPVTTATDTKYCIYSAGNGLVCNSTPEGSGDFSSNTATSVDGEIVLFNSTTGKQGKRATGSGIVSVVDGVFSTKEFTRGVTVQNLTETDDNKPYLGSWVNNVTITKVGCYYEGTSAPATVANVTLEDGSGNAMTITDTNPACVAQNQTMTFKAVTANNTLISGESLAFDVTNTPTTGYNYTIVVGGRNTD